MDEGRYRVSIPDIDYYRQNIRCQSGCPVHTDARGYVLAIREGDYERAYRIAREPNPFASICGWVCNAPCEARGACTRGQVDQAVSIRALKRFVDERFGVDTKLPSAAVHHSQDQWAKPQPQVTWLPNNSHLWNSLTALQRLRTRREADGTQVKTTGRKVAIIGAGPAGLTCAHDLAILGYRVTVFEEKDYVGGMITAGVPAYRLPNELIQLEIQAILDLGVEIRLNTRVGRDITVNDLKNQGYQAIFLGTGLFKSRELPIEGVNLGRVYRAIEFLEQVKLGKFNGELGNNVVVIGGGNVAADVCRTASRYDPHSAMPGPWKREVHVYCLEDFQEMPMDEIEREDALDEGIFIHTRWGPNKILGSNGGVTGIELIKVASVFDEQGRFNPQFIPGTETTVECDSVILSIGQGADLSYLLEEDGVQISPRGLIAADPETLATTGEGIFAGGDVVLGPRLIIDAVAQGQKAARSIDAYLREEKIEVVQRATMTMVNPAEYLDPVWMQITRRRPLMTPVGERGQWNMDEVRVYSEEDAIAQGTRCFNCSVNTIFDGDICIGCGDCVDVCPWYCLKMVPLDELEATPDFKTLSEARYGAPLEMVASIKDPHNPGGGWAMLKDDDRCTRCALCADICPVRCITMEAFHFEEELVTVSR